MKKVLCFTCFVLWLLACKKAETISPPADGYTNHVFTALRDSLSSADYGTLELAKAEQINFDSIHLLRIPLAKDIKRQFLLLRTTASGAIIKGSFLTITINQSSRDSSFDGSIAYRSFEGEVKVYPIIKGFIINPSATVSTNPVTQREAVMMGSELPEVIVTTSYQSGVSFTDWYNLLAMLYGGQGYWGNNFSPEITGGGGGGTGVNSSTAPVDFEFPESMATVELAKYLKCFGAIPDAGASFTITIAADIPVDGNPTKFFNWSDGSPGHAYVELYKLGSSGLVSQSIGFYPNNSWKVTGGGDVASKIVDDGNHEYNARYTIAVNAAQFHAALNAIQMLSNNDYNVATNNCADFALGVFNAAGGNLAIPKYTIPGFANGAAKSNTPQGLYDKISDLAIAGNSSAQTNGNKAYGNSSHGPCN